MGRSSGAKVGGGLSGVGAMATLAANVVLVNGTPTEILSLPLTQGNWLLLAHVSWYRSTIVTLEHQLSWIGGVSASTTSVYASSEVQDATQITSVDDYNHVIMCRYVAAGIETVYLNVQSEDASTIYATGHDGGLPTVTYLIATPCY